MHTTITYKGTRNGIHGLWCGFKPDDVIVEEEITVYHPDEGKEFMKNGERFSAVVLQEGEKIEDYEQVDEEKPERPEDREEGRPEAQEPSEPVAE